MCKQVIGVLQELGRSCLLHGNSRQHGDACTSETHPACRSGISGGKERTDDAAVVSPSEGNEVRREGRQDVVAS
jgi:hypothetical protein